MQCVHCSMRTGQQCQPQQASMRTGQQCGRMNFKPLQDILPMLTIFAKISMRTVVNIVIR